MCSEHETRSGCSASAEQQSKADALKNLIMNGICSELNSYQPISPTNYLIYSQTHESIASLRSSLGINEKQVVYIESFEDFEKFLLLPEQEKGKETILYRGHGEAEWVYRPTLQRDFVSGGGCRDCKKSACQAWKEVLESYYANLSNSDRFENSQAKETCMQHYGEKTIFLDLTKDLFAALYFATHQTVPNHVLGSPREKSIKDYASVLRLWGNDEQLIDWEKNRSSSYVECSEAHLPMMMQDILRWDNVDNTSGLVGIKKHLVYIDQSGSRQISNPRMEKQKGVLMYVGNDRWSSLESRIRACRSACKPECPSVRLYLINKRLCPLINLWLNAEKGINAQSLGLEETPTLKISGKIRFTCNNGQ